MIKWIIIVALILVANLGLKPLLVDSQQIIVTDRLAVAQLEDSDENAIAMRANERVAGWVTPVFITGSIALIGLGLYSDRKKIKEAMG